MNSSLYLISILAVLLMGGITYLLRAFPTFVPKKILESAILRQFNFALPLSVMMVLILASLNITPNDLNWAEIMAKAGALFVVLFSYLWRRNVFLSVIIGVAAVNGFLALFNLLNLF